MRAGVDGVVIADHNSHAAIDPLRAALNDLREQRHTDFREIVLFPGVEITVNDGYHLLGVFDPATDAEVVNGIIHNSGYSGKRGSSAATANSSLIQIADLIVKAGGLAVPAHCDGPRGALSMDERSFSELVRAGTVIAAEFIKPPIGKGVSSGWAPVLGSDAHHLDGDAAPVGVEPKFPGSHFTWLKAETLNLAGLILALADPVHSVLRSTDVDFDPNETTHSRLISVELHHGGDVVAFNLSPWLNSIIGGRGVGKSTLLQIIRLGLGRFDELPDPLQLEYEWYSPTGGGERFWDESTEIRIEFLKEGTIYRTTWIGTSPQSPQIESFSNEGWAPEQGNIAERFPILIYSQKQIYETARDPQSLLAVIDSQASIRKAEWIAQRDQLQARYAEALQRIAANSALVGEATRVSGELSDARARKTKLGELRDSGLLTELDSLLSNQRTHGSTERAIGEYAERLAAANTGILELLDKALLANPTAAETGRYQAVRSTQQTVDAAATALKELLSGQAEDVERTTRISEVQQRLVETGGETAKDSTSMEVITSDFQQTSDSVAALESQLEAIRVAGNETSTLVSEAETTLDAIKTHRAELTARRKQFIKSLNLAGANVSLDLFEMGDRTTLEEDLRAALQIPTSFDRFFTGNDGVALLLPNSPLSPKAAGDLVHLRDFLKSIKTEGQDSSLLQSSGVFVEGRMHSRLAALDSVTFDSAIDLWFPEDLLRVRYKPEGESNYRALEHGSPGEKTATLLSLILRMSNDPLILDQPEDDLDNELITELVVKTLQETKSNRQVIVVTHNANVVVNADSERVFVVRFGPIPVLALQGSIQDTDVRAAICRIMEGGKQAFEARYQRLLG
jgi:hypothetical protein